MGRRQDYVIAWLEVRGERFEILVRPEYAFRYREGEGVPLDDVLWIDIVYRDARKGLKASPESLRRAFGVDDPRRVAELILREGEIQLTSEERRKLLEAKRRRVITYIARNAVDPRTGKPIPEARIESAMEELRIGVDLYKDVESQAVEIVRRIARIMPIRLSKALLEVRVPPAYSGRAYGELRRLGEVKKSEWLADGTLLVELEIPAGSQVDVINRIQAISRGGAQVKVRVVE